MWYDIKKRKYWGLVEELQTNKVVSVKTVCKPNRKIEGKYFTLFPDGTLWLWIDYLWDGCSGLTFDRKRGRSRKSSAVHDCLYFILKKYDNPGFTRAEADLEFLIRGLIERMVPLRIITYYTFVRLLGGIWMWKDKQTWRLL